ncbi:hypothetical protein [Streptomyces sp. NBC_01422]|uniref:hypothetical protein n=1 Tax=Streptomyces sp. NBC_01422 TaxID=2903859 RepID=UPI002E2D59F1|nr:hypothetical protein [Streptomyces sp. NBC_01422]
MPDTQPIPFDGEQQPAADSSTPPMPATPPAALTAGQAPARRSRLRTLTTFLVGVAAGAAIVGGTWYTTSPDNDSTSSSGDKATTGLPADIINTEPDGTFTLEGEFTLTEGAISDGIGGCEGDGGYNDIELGTSVTVYDAAGSVIATSALILSEFDEAAGSCTYDVSVEDVPAGEDFYQVEISHRGKIQLSAEEAQSGSFAGSLGD